MRRKQAKNSRTGAAKQSQTLRIIGGDWRGRTFSFPAVEGLRPTPDRVRETLFNWLAGRLRDCRCLDLFAGSGALGLEALSRGAAYCDFVDSNRLASTAITAHLQALGASARGRVHSCNASDFIDSAGAYDIVFIDPPFSQLITAQIAAQLVTTGCLSASGLIYAERSIKTPEPELSPVLERLKQKRAGEVVFELYQLGSMD